MYVILNHGVPCSSVENHEAIAIMSQSCWCASVCVCEKSSVMCVCACVTPCAVGSHWNPFWDNNHRNPQSPPPPTHHTVLSNSNKTKSSVYIKTMTAEVSLVS